MDPVHCSADCEGEPKHWDADGRKEAARAPAPAHMSISLPGRSMQPIAQHSNTTAYVMFDGPIKTGFADD